MFRPAAHAHKAENSKMELEEDRQVAERSPAMLSTPLNFWDKARSRATKDRCTLVGEEGGSDTGWTRVLGRVGDGKGERQNTKLACFGLPLNELELFFYKYMILIHSNMVGPLIRYKEGIQGCNRGLIHKCRSPAKRSTYSEIPTS